MEARKEEIKKHKRSAFRNLRIPISIIEKRPTLIPRTSEAKIHENKIN